MIPTVVTSPLSVYHLSTISYHLSAISLSPLRYQFITSPLSVITSPLSVVTSPLSVITSPLSVVTSPLSVITSPLSVVTSPLSVITSPLSVVTSPLSVYHLSTISYHLSAISLSPLRYQLSPLRYYKGGLKGQELHLAQGRAKRHPGLYVHFTLTPCKGKSIMCQWNNCLTTRLEDGISITGDGKVRRTFPSPVSRQQAKAFGKRYTEDLKFFQSEVRLRTQFVQSLTNFEKFV